MPSGKIKKIAEDKGYGFIKRDEDGTDVFFHISGLVQGVRFEELKEGMAVEFVEDVHNQRPCATEVEPINGA